MAEPANPELRHFTARRGFVILMGFLILTLYFLWAGYGAAPTSLSFLTEPDDESAGGMAGMAGMVQSSEATGMSPDKFSDLTEKFVDDLSLPDGSVRPTRQWTVAMATREGPMTAMKPYEAAAVASPAQIAAAAAREEKVGHAHGEEDEPIDVFLMAMRFSYSPNVLRLKHGVPYRFRMMSMDVNHGVSINTGTAGHIMRRPAKVMVDTVMVFPDPGEFMMYCTVYCGLGHGEMKGKIIVE